MAARAAAGSITCVASKAQAGPHVAGNPPCIGCWPVAAASTRLAEHSHQPWRQLLLSGSVCCLGIPIVERTTAQRAGSAHAFSHLAFPINRSLLQSP